MSDECPCDACSDGRSRQPERERLLAKGVLGWDYHKGPMIGGKSVRDVMGRHYQCDPPLVVAIYEVAK
jgi:hypothetical protein